MKQIRRVNFWHAISLYTGGRYLAGIESSLFTSLRTQFSTSGDSPAGVTDLGQLILLVVQILLLAAGSVAVIFLIIGGYRYVVAHGNEEQAEAAKKTMTSAILGIVIITLAFAIIQIIVSVLLKGTLGLGI